jgi:hypothetical protein
MTTQDGHNEIKETKYQDQSWKQINMERSNKKKFNQQKNKKNVIVWIHNANKNAFTMDAIMNLSENNINHII